MNNRISDLLDCLEDVGQDLETQSGNAERVKQRTFEKLHREQTLPIAQTRQSPRHPSRPLAGLIAAVITVMLLCSTAFAAWKLGAFHFADEFGPAGEALDASAQTYEPEASDAISADYGYKSWVYVDAGDYNLILLNLTASNGELRATVDVSPKREGLPAFRDSSLALSFADYETVSTAPRQIDAWKDRVELCASLEVPLSTDAEITFCLSGPGSEPCLANFRMDALENARLEMESSELHHYAAAAKTKDYRFSLRSLTASASVIYAVVDVEALTDYGMEHLDLTPELMLYNHSRQNSGTHMDARLVGKEEGVCRYLIGYLGNQPLNEAGDSITFEVLELFEEGDLSGHPYYLFDVKIEKLIPDAITFIHPQGTPSGSITWQSLHIDALGLTIEGLGKYGYDEVGPTVELVFSDGTRETVLDEGWRPFSNRSAHDAVNRDLTGWHDGTAHLSLIFGAPLEPTELKSVVVDGQVFQFIP